MILEQETFDKFGYFPANLKKYSHKPILVQCEYCKEISEKSKSSLEGNLKINQSKTHCCKKCKGRKARETINNIPGLAENIIKNTQETMLKKYGTICVMNEPDMQAKIKEQNLEKYGVDHHLKSPIIRDKIKATNMANHGTANPFSVKKFQDQIFDTNYRKYGRKYCNQQHIPQDSINKIRNRDWLYDQHVNQKKCLRQISQELGFAKGSGMASLMCQRLGVPVQKYSVSIAESEIIEYLKSIGITDLIQSDRTAIKPQELDIYSPSLKIAVEYSGLYWHTDTYLKSNYHQKKYQNCRDAGIRLVTIFEDEWLKTPELVKARLKDVFKPNLNTTTWITEEHPDNTFIATDYFTKTPIASVKFKEFQKGRYEILEYSGQLETTLTWFIKTKNPISIAGVCDLRWEVPETFLGLEFKQVRKTKPRSFYVTEHYQTRSDFPDPTEPPENQVKTHDCGLIYFLWSKPTP